MLSFKNGAPFSQVIHWPPAQWRPARVSCGLWSQLAYPSQASTERGQREADKGTARQWAHYICGPGCSCQDLCHLFFFLLRQESAWKWVSAPRTGLWLSSPCLKASVFGGLRDEPPGPPAPHQLLCPGVGSSRGRTLVDVAH